MGRPLTSSEAAATLRRGRAIEQFIALDGDQLTYLVVSPRAAGFQLIRHVVRDEGTEEFRDISEFSPVDEAEYVGEGVTQWPSGSVRPLWQAITESRIAVTSSSTIARSASTSAT